MTATIPVTCPKCQKKMKAPAALAGKKVRCKGCGESITIEEAKAKVAGETKAKAEKPKPADDEWGPAKAYGAIDVSLAVRCPFCALELQNADDVVCLNCGYNLQTRTRIEQRVLHPTFAMEYFIWWLPGIACALAALAFAFAGIAIWVDAIPFPDWLTWVREWLWAKLYGTAMCAGIAWSTGYFAVKRLIRNWKPPEREKAKDKED